LSFGWALEAFAAFQRDASGRPAYAIAAVQDISERERPDEELRQAKEAANRAKDECRGAPRGVDGISIEKLRDQAR
jgi:hypothetical protein